MPSSIKIPATIANDNSIGVSAWSGLTNLGASDNLHASVNNSPGDISQYLKCTGCAFAIPTGAIITGIEVYFERGSSGSGDTQDYSIRLVKGGVIQGDNKAVAGNWPASDNGATYGSPTDLWGITLTPSDVNASDFGAVIANQETEDKSDSDTGRIDVITITVHYTINSPSASRSPSASASASTSPSASQSPSTSISPSASVSPSASSSSSRSPSASSSLSVSPSASVSSSISPSASSSPSRSPSSSSSPSNSPSASVSPSFELFGRIPSVISVQNRGGVLIGVRKGTIL